ncbi:DUF4391 domain-containing protein [bacterium]|nr:DUF4391 domain-containing protein [bacterium]
MEIKLNLPKSAYFNKFIPKSKFYEKAGINSKLQAEFVDKIQRITWKYKLAESTINIAKTQQVQEIQIFEVQLKVMYQPKQILKAIDKAIPYPILYILTYQEMHAYAIAYNDDYIGNKYYFSDWDQEINFDFSGLDLEKVYQKIVRALLDYDDANQEVRQAINYDYEISNIQTRIDKLTLKLKREKQFNKKVQIQKELIEEEKKLTKLKG